MHRLRPLNEETSVQGSERREDARRVPAPRRANAGCGRNVSRADATGQTKSDSAAKGRRIDNGYVDLQPESTNAEHRTMQIAAQLEDFEMGGGGIVGTAAL